MSALVDDAVRVMALEAGVSEEAMRRMLAAPCDSVDVPLVREDLEFMARLLRFLMEHCEESPTQTMIPRMIDLTSRVHAYTGWTIDGDGGVS